MQKKAKTWIWLATVGVVIAAFNFSTITHKFGAYSGRVVDKETGGPVAGAYVLVAYHTERYSPSGPVKEFLEAGEATTDKDGLFKIDAFRAWAFRFPQRWAEDTLVTIYKPGYAARFPHTIIPQEHVTEELTKLNTYDERRRALSAYRPLIPEEKSEHLRKLLDEEDKHLNLWAESLKPKLSPRPRSDVIKVRSVKIPPGEVVLVNTDTGEEWIVRVGDSKDGWTVLEIGPANVTLLLHSTDKYTAEKVTIPAAPEPGTPSP
ncbi:MAG: carboxypeptidase-like regulatory domain-containing protein [Syntrophobacteraceae bacterium]